MCKERLEEIEGLIEQIPSHNRILDDDGEQTKLFVEKGSAIARSIFQDELGRVSVVRATLSENTRFEYHTHNQTEILSVYEGRLILTVNDPEEKDEKIVILNEGDAYIINKGIPHNAYCDVKTKMIAHIMPTPQPDSDNGGTV